MFSHRMFWIQLGVLLLVAVLHAVGVYASLYWIWKPFDIVTHFLGGVWVALAALWLFFFSPFFQMVFSPKAALWVVLAAIVVVGGAWEVFEFAVDVPTELLYWGDTLLDLVMDVCGALSAWWVTKRWYA